MKHIPVLLSAVMENLGEILGKNIIDATFGAGGYTRAFLESGANVTAFDRDPNVIEDAEMIKKEFGDRFTFVSKPFSYISELTDEYDAIIFDLGISSMQIDVASRGFSFRFDGPLDMRMSGSGINASELIANTDKQSLAKILRDYGDVKKANVLARVMRQKLPQTTFELRDLIYNPNDVAPVFQALRIAVNDEMGELERALNAVPKLLKVGGKCICVTFHSLEDRIVKSTFRDWTLVPGDVRIPSNQAAQFELLKTIVPTDTELKDNPRARSAHLRAVKKLY